MKVLQCEKDCARTRQCRVLYFEVHGDFNAAGRAANVPVSAHMSPPVRIQEGCPAPSTPEKLPERGLDRVWCTRRWSLSESPKLFAITVACV